MQKISKKYNNRDYAPGLALYGIDGKDGVSGESGCSVFVCQFDFNTDEGVQSFSTRVKQLRRFSRLLRHGMSSTSIWIR